MDDNSPHSFWSPYGFASATGGQLLGVQHADDPRARRTITDVSTDTRTLEPGQAFLALRGEQFDGHMFIDKAQKIGASLLIVAQDHECESLEPDSIPMLVVDDTLDALQQLARAWRQHLRDTFIIGITGSAGKTTTKVMLHQVLSSALRGSASPRSFNNHIGLPLAILAGRPDHEYLILEIGTNHPGEIAALCDIAQPDAAIVTSIGRAHLEGLGSIEGVAREKGALPRSLRGSKSWALLVANHPVLGADVRDEVRVVQIGSNERDTGADLYLSSYESRGPAGASFALNDGSEWRLALEGRHNALNAAFVITAARRLGVPDDLIHQALAVAAPPAMRFVDELIAGVHVTNDAYNANPESMLASIQTFVDRQPTCAPHEKTDGNIEDRTILILGEMRELGEKSDECHAEVAEQVFQNLHSGSIDEVRFVGAMWSIVRSRIESLDSCALFDDVNPETMHHIAESLRAGDHVLIKGSRSNKLEDIIAHLKERTVDSMSAQA